MQSPFVNGRVWFYPRQNDPEMLLIPAMPGSKRAPCAATIVWVHGERLVNLAVLDHYGNSHSRAQVVLVQDGDLAPPYDFCTFCREP